MIATSVFCCGDTAARTPGNWMNRLPSSECKIALVFASALVPNTTALKTHRLATFTSRLVAAPTGFSYYLSTIRSRTPLQILVFTDAYIFVNYLESGCNFLGTKLFNVFFGKLFLALCDHARNPYDFASLNTCRQMVSCAVLTKSVAAC